MYDRPIPVALDDRTYQIHFFGVPSSDGKTPLIIMPVAGEADETIEGQHMRLDPLITSGQAAPHVLVVFQTKNWDDDLTPWPAKGIGRGQPDFGGLASQTLCWLTQRLIPDVLSHVPPLQESKLGLLG